MVLTENKKTLLLILIAFIFSVSLRFIWVEQFSGYEQFKFNDQFMINTNDGYYFAEGARDILAGFHQKGDLSPVDTAMSKLTALLAKLLPFSFESIIFYMPVFFSSLLVIPLILIGRAFHRLDIGFISALLASIAWSYYNRTMAGYFDTDLLNIVFPTLLLWSLIWAFKTKENRYILFVALDIIAYRWWYPQSYSLEFAFFALIAVYTIYVYIKKEDIKYYILLLSFILFSMVAIDDLIRLSIVLLLYLGLSVKKDIFIKYIYYIFGISLILFFITGGFDPIWNQLKGYVFKESISSASEGLGLHFFTVMQTIREAGNISFETFANRISGHTITFILSFIGLIWFIVSHRVMLLTLPMLGLGFLAYGIPGLIPAGGLRFTIYAVPIMALGAGYFIVEFSKLFSSKKLYQYTLISFLSIGVLYPNIQHIIDYKIPTVFTQNEVKVLDRLKDIASREDYAISWWDYGYPIRYYADVKTLVDGGKHSGSANFPVSFALSSSEDSALKMARLDVEYTEIKDTRKLGSNIERMSVDYGYKDTNDFIGSLETNIELPKKTRDIYLYLPNRMMGILPTINAFSNIDLMSGKKMKNPFFYLARQHIQEGSKINLGRGIYIDSAKGQLEINGRLVGINRFITTRYDRLGILHKQTQRLDISSSINVIYMQNYNQFVLLDDKLFNSLYIQYFVLEHYDRSLVEPIILDPMVKVFRLKI